MGCRDAGASLAQLGRRNANAGPNSSGNRFSNAPEVLLPGTNLVRLAAGTVGVFPGLDFPAPLQARRALFTDRALTGQIVLILQWARIVTESQSGTATGGNPSAAHRYPENI